MPLPSSFESALDTLLKQRSHGSWAPLNNQDSFGNLLETELGEVFRTTERIGKETGYLPKYFPENGDYGPSSPSMASPGAIRDIIDFSRILSFAISGGGEPFCFDYRKSLGNPFVIFWDDVYWRRVSPDFTAFLKLFDVSTRT